MFKLRDDIWIRMNSINLVIDRGYAGMKRRIRIYTTDGRHEYDLTTEEWSRFELALKDKESKKK